LKGPPGSGKKALALALIGEIFGDACWNVCPWLSDAITLMIFLS